MIKLKPLAVSVLIALGVGGLSALLTNSSMEHYGQLKQPPLAPPGWLFPIVWTILFLLMGIAAYLVWMQNDPDRKTALTLYAVQLGFNFFWTIIFFNLRSYGLALVWLIALWVLILLTVKYFYQSTHTAGILLVPYLLWVTFAAYLNAGVWWLN